MKILIVDDEPRFGQLLALVLRRALRTAQPKLALSGAEALAVMQPEPPDILITDTNMSPMDGITLIRNVRQNYPDVLIVSLFSGLVGSTITKADVQAMGVYSVLEKSEIEAKMLPMLGALVSHKLNSN